MARQSLRRGSSAYREPQEALITLRHSRSKHLNPLTQLPKHDATELYRYRDGIYAPELLGAALVGLDFFTWLARSPASAQAICQSLGLAERPVDVMLTLFSAMGLVEASKGAFRVTDIAKDFLVRESPWSIGPYFAPFADRPVCRDLLQVLRTGKPANWASRKDTKPWAEELKENAFSEQFTKMMDARGLYLGPNLARRLDFGRFRHVLDVGGASGIYSCCLTAAYPRLSATVLEKAPTDGVARRSIENRGYSDRVAVATGDMFTSPFPEGCDVHLFSNVLHDWDVPAAKRLLRKSYAALPDGGMIVIHDMHLNRQKTGPQAVAAHSVFLMTITEGRYYSVAEIEDFLSEAGFSGMKYRKNALDFSIITARKTRPK